MAFCEDDDTEEEDEVVDMGVEGGSTGAIRYGILGGLVGLVAIAAGVYLCINEYEKGQVDEKKVYLIGGYPALAAIGGLTFLLSLWRLIDDPSYSFLSDKAFNIVMGRVVPALVTTLAISMVICMINGEAPGSETVPPGNLTKVVVLLVLFIILAVVSYYLEAFIPFVAGSFFGTCAVYFLAFILFAVNPHRNPMLTEPKFDPDATSLSFYVFLVPPGMGLLNAGCYLIFTKAAGFSRLTAGKFAAIIGFVVIQVIGAKNYPGFSNAEKLVYLAGSLGIYVFVFTGVALWTEEGILAQTDAFKSVLA